MERKSCIERFPSWLAAVDGQKRNGHKISVILMQKVYVVMISPTLLSHTHTFQPTTSNVFARLTENGRDDDVDGGDGSAAVKAQRVRRAGRVHERHTAAGGKRKTTIGRATLMENNNKKFDSLPSTRKKKKTQQKKCRLLYRLNIIPLLQPERSPPRSELKSFY